ncbi:MAG: hypothetical protein ACYDEY_04955 [Acidimicrobiales bacterium]
MSAIVGLIDDRATREQLFSGRGKRRLIVLQPSDVVSALFYQPASVLTLGVFSELRAGRGIPSSANSENCA